MNLNIINIKFQWIITYNAFIYRLIYYNIILYLRIEIDNDNLIKWYNNPFWETVKILKSSLDFV